MTDGPYAQSALSYARNAWQGVLPIAGKFPPPTGYTGTQGIWPSVADMAAWAEGAEGALNIGLRLPAHVVGIDVDNYDGKTGAGTLDDAVAVWGELPDTWTSTSRDDGVSGIRLFSVPPGLRWPGQLGASVEIIQWKHRYAMCWPSIHPSTGRRYEWLMPATGANTDHGPLPHADELPALPESWVAALTKGEAETDIAKVSLSDRAVMAWLKDNHDLPRCVAVSTALHRASEELRHRSGSRHDAAMRGSARLAMLAAEGHQGATSALGELRSRFADALGNDRGDVEGEWARMVTGAVEIAATRERCTVDPCSFGLLHVAGGTSAAPALGGQATPGLLTVPPAGAVTPGDAGWGTPAPTLHEPVPGVQPASSTPQLDPALAFELAQQRARRAAKGILDAEEHARHFRVPPHERTLTAELALPDVPIPYRIAEVCPTGANVLLTAQYKSGKTSMLNHLAKCLVDGDSFLGELGVEVPDGRVAIFNYEVGREQFRRWLREVGITNTDRISVLNLRGFSMPLMVPAVTEWVIAWLAEHEIATWFLDPYARAAVGSITSENDNTEAGKLLDHLDVIKARAGVSELIVPVHTGRAEFEQGSERARGATRLDDWADVRWLLTVDKDTGQRFFRASGRDVEYSEKGLEYNDTVRGYSIVGGNRQQSKQERYKNAIIAAALNSPDISLTAMRKAVKGILNGADNTKIAEAISELEDEGTLIVTRSPNPGSPTTHRLNPFHSPR